VRLAWLLLEMAAGVSASVLTLVMVGARAVAGVLWKAHDAAWRRADRLRNP